jgi:hypothetical protein
MEGLTKGVHLVGDIMYDALLEGVPQQNGHHRFLHTLIYDEGVIKIDPVFYLYMVLLESMTRLILTDSREFRKRPIGLKCLELAPLSWTPQKGDNRSREVSDDEATAIH